MVKYFVMLKENARSLKNVRVLVGVSMFFALNVIMNLYVSFYITNEIKIGFASIATAASCYFFGPVPNLLVAPLLDFVNFYAKPMGTYYPIFMISTFVTAIIFSLTLWGKNEISITRAIVTRLLYDAIVSLFLNSLFTSMLWGTPFLAIVGPKVVKNVISLPIQVFVLFFVMKACTQIKKRMRY